MIEAVIGALVVLGGAIAALFAAWTRERDKRRAVEKSAAAQKQRDAIEDRLAVKDRAAEALAQRREAEAKAASERRKNEIARAWHSAMGETITDAKLEELLKQRDERMKELDDEGGDN